MGFWSKLLGMDSVVEKGMEMADEAFYTDQEKSSDDSFDTNSARTFQATSSTATDWFNKWVDGVSRLVRPWITIHVVGGQLGYWQLPAVKDNGWGEIFWLIITFWFGGRALLKDLPNAISYMRGK